MERTIFRAGMLIWFLIDSAASWPRHSPQLLQPGAANPDPSKPPDMVCFGYGPKWSVQFINGEARYLGVNQPDQTFLGDFYWVPEDKAWEWHRANGLAPMNGGYGLSATIQKQACTDPVRKANLSVLGAGQSAARRHGERLLPQAAARAKLRWGSTDCSRSTPDQRHFAVLDTGYIERSARGLAAEYRSSTRSTTSYVAGRRRTDRITS